MKRRVRSVMAAKQPTFNAPEGVRAAWFREYRLKLSRPALGEILGLTNRTIERYEKMAKVPELYRWALAALAARIEFDWDTAKAKVGNSTITF